MGYNPQEIHNKYHGYTVRGTPNCPLNLSPNSSPQKNRTVNFCNRGTMTGTLIHRSHTAAVLHITSKKTPTYPMNIPQTRITGNPFIFVFWGTWGMFQGSVGIVLDSNVWFFPNFKADWLAMWVLLVARAVLTPASSLWRFRPSALQIPDGTEPMQPAATRNQLMVSWWFGILGIHPSNNPFHKRIPGIQTTGPQSNN